MTLGERIRAARKKAGLTQAELAARCGWDPPSRLGNYEQNAREPVLSDLQKIADNVREGGCSYAWIVLGDIPSQPTRFDEEILAIAIETAAKAKTGIRADKVIALYEMLEQEKRQSVVELPRPSIGRSSSGESMHGTDKRGTRRVEGASEREGPQQSTTKRAS